MKIILFSRVRVSHVASDISLILSLIERYGFDYCVNEEFAGIIKSTLGFDVPLDKQYTQRVGEQPHPSVMVCYGGDGTLLEGVERLGGQPIVVAGINSGRLGFLTTTSREGIERLFELIATSGLKSQKRTLLRVEGDFAPEQSFLATNEFSVQRLGASMISVDTYLDSELVATYYGDGVVVATPTGSTAYSLSAGGPIVAPMCGCLIISPIAPHNLTMRPLVVPVGSTIEMNIHMREGDAYICLDNRSYNISATTKVRITKASESLYLAQREGASFYETLREKMMWGVDIR